MVLYSIRLPIAASCLALALSFPCSAEQDIPVDNQYQSEKKGLVELDEFSLEQYDIPNTPPSFTKTTTKSSEESDTLPDHFRDIQQPPTIKTTPADFDPNIYLGIRWLGDGPPNR